MKIILYSMTSDKRKIGKTKAKLFELDNVVMKEGTSVINPTFVFNRKKPRQNEILPNYFSCNYIYCYDTKKKYYFVNDIRMNNASALEFICTEDVLETYKNNILSLTTLIERQENVYSPYIVDNELKLSTANKKTGISRVLDKYSVGFLGNNISYVITTVGGGE